MAENYINKFKKKGTEEYYDIVATSASTSLSAETSVYAETAGNVNAIGKVEKYSGYFSGKTREGLKIVNNAYTGSNPNYSIIEMNSNGNLAVESLAKHVNIEAKQAVQIKPTTNVIFDSSRRILNSQGNEVHLEAKFDDFKNYNKGEAPEYNGHSGNDEQWAELKIHSRNVDLRCHEHGGIALQVAGCDHYNDTGASVVHHENKIKFESSRKTPVQDNYSVTKNDYLDEGGKGMEFGTFNNEHASLYCGDYRFKKNAKVYGVTREALDNTYDSTGKLVKVDYPTQEDDFKDVINETTPNATWNEIIDAANKCKNKEAIASEDYVDSKITERIVEIEGGGSISLDGYATTEYVNNAIAAAGGGSALVPGNGISIADGEISVNHYDDIEPLTALTENLEALKYIEIGDSKGNFQIDNKNAYTYQATIDTTDENFNPVSKDARIQVSNIADEGYYTDERKYYYSPTINTFDHNHNEINAKVPVLKYIETVVNNEHIYTKNISDEEETTFYQDESKIYYKANKKSAAMRDNSKVAKNWIVITDSDIAALNSASSTTVSQDDIDSYYSTSPDWDLAYIWKKGMKDEEGNKYWPSGKIWEVNEININLETGSKIKFAGEKIEVLNSKDDGFGNDIAMKSTKVMSDEIEVFTSALTFSRSVTKNGVETGYDPIISFEYKNNVADTDKVPDLATFIVNYKSKHAGTTLSDAEIEEIYNRLSNEVGYETVSVKLSDLLKLVSKVSELESRIEALENQN